MRLNRFFLLLSASLPVLGAAAVVSAEAAGGSPTRPVTTSSAGARVDAVADADDVPSLRKRAEELKQEVDRLRAENQRLRRALEESARRKVETRVIPPDRQLLPNGRPAPREWIRRGDGSGVWHYLVPLSDNTSRAIPRTPAELPHPSAKAGPAAGR